MIERSIKIELSAKGSGSLEVSTYDGIVSFTVRANHAPGREVIAWDMPGNDRARLFLLEAVRLTELAEAEENEADEP